MKRLIPILILAAIACSKPVATVKEKVKDIAEDISTPWGQREDPAAREKERFDQEWRQMQSFRALQLRQLREAQAAQPPPNLRFVSGVKATLKHLDANAINNAPIK